MRLLFEVSDKSQWGKKKKRYTPQSNINDVVLLVFVSCKSSLTEQWVTPT